MVASCLFPQEITDAIVDCVADDRTTLKACALTRRAWLQRSRHHLHRKVTIEGGSRKSCDYYSTPAAQHVRELKLFCPPQPSLSGRPGDNTLWTIISRFTEISSLTLLYTSWSGKTWKSLASIARNVTHLELLVTSFDNCDEFFAFVAMFPQLESLVLTSVSFGSAFARSGVRNDPPATLVSLRLGAHSLQPAIAQRFADWLAYLPVSAVPRFSLFWKAPTQYGLVPALQAVGSRLLHLELPVSPDVEMDIEGNIGEKLQSISFTVSGDFTTDKITEVTSMLSQIHSVDVHKIEILFSGTSLVDLDVSALQPIDTILSGNQYEDLKSLRFAFAGKSCSAEVDQPDAFTERLRRTLRRVTARGLLSVDFQ